MAETIFGHTLQLSTGRLFQHDGWRNNVREDLALSLFRRLDEGHTPRAVMGRAQRLEDLPALQLIAVRGGAHA